MNVPHYDAEFLICSGPVLPLQQTNTLLFVPVLRAGQVPVNNFLIWGESHKSLERAKTAMLPFYSD